MYSGELRKRKALYVERNIEGPSCNHCCSGKAISIIDSEWVFVAVGIQHVMRMRRIVIFGLPGSLYFSTLAHKDKIFEKFYWK